MLGFQDEYNQETHTDVDLREATRDLNIADLPQQGLVVQRMETFMSEYQHDEQSKQPIKIENHLPRLLLNTKKSERVASGILKDGSK